MSIRKGIMRTEQDSGCRRRCGSGKGCPGPVQASAGQCKCAPSHVSRDGDDEPWQPVAVNTSYCTTHWHTLTHTGTHGHTLAHTGTQYSVSGICAAWRPCPIKAHSVAIAAYYWRPPPSPVPLWQRFAPGVQARPDSLLRRTCRSAASSDRRSDSSASSAQGHSPTTQQPQP